jgi:transposase-like protein
MEERLASTGTFCPQQGCQYYAKVGADNIIIKYGRTRRGVQRYRCESCGATFSATHGTLFYRKRTPRQRTFWKPWHCWPREYA